MDELREILTEVRQIELVSSRLVTDAMSGAYNSVFRGSGVEFSEVREYVDGDDPRSVDWNVTARLGRPFVKKFVDERELSVIFATDISPSMVSGFGAWSARQVMARICAAIGLAAHRNNDKVGFMPFGGGGLGYLSPRKGSSQTLRIVRDILDSRQSTSRDGASMADALDFLARVPRRHAVVFLISDFMDENWEASLSFCSRRHDVVAIRLLPQELRKPGGGLVRLQNPETDEVQVVDWRNRSVAQEYHERVSNWRRNVAAALVSMNVELIDISMPKERDYDAIARPILKFFHSRQARD